MVSLGEGRKWRIRDNKKSSEKGKKRGYMNFCFAPPHGFVVSSTCCLFVLFDLYVVVILFRATVLHHGSGTRSPAQYSCSSVVSDTVGHHSNWLVRGKRGGDIISTPAVMPPSLSASVSVKVSVSTRP